MALAALPSADKALEPGGLDYRLLREQATTNCAIADAELALPYVVRDALSESLPPPISLAGIDAVDGAFGNPLLRVVLCRHYETSLANEDDWLKRLQGEVQRKSQERDDRELQWKADLSERVRQIILHRTGHRTSSFTPPVSMPTSKEGPDVDNSERNDNNVDRQLNDDAPTLSVGVVPLETRAAHESDGASVYLCRHVCSDTQWRTFLLPDIDEAAQGPTEESGPPTTTTNGRIIAVPTILPADFCAFLVAELRRRLDPIHLAEAAEREALMMTQQQQHATIRHQQQRQSLGREHPGTAEQSIAAGNRWSSSGAVEYARECCETVSCK